MTSEENKFEEKSSKLLNKETEYYSKLVELYDLDSCVQWIVNNKFEKVCLQFPESLLIDSVDIAAYIESKISKKIYILGDTAYGSCCVDEVASKHVDGNAVIHFGHACLSPVVSVPVFYVFPKKKLDVKKFLDTLADMEDLPSPILLLYDVSYSHHLDEVRNQVNRLDRKTLREKLCISNLILPDQQELIHVCSPWCMLNHKPNSAHFCTRLQRAFCLPPNGYFLSLVYIGEATPNLFNFLHIFKDCQTLNYTEERGMEEICRACVNKQLSYLVERIRASNNIGIVVATLGIQGYRDALEHAKSLCKNSNKKCYILSIGKPNPAKLANFAEIDLFVAISCPESDFGDRKQYLQPIVGLYELDSALNMSRPWLVGYTRDFRDVIKDVQRNSEKRVVMQLLVHTSEVSANSAEREIGGIGGRVKGNNGGGIGYNRGGAGYGGTGGNGGRVRIGGGRGGTTGGRMGRSEKKGENNVEEEYGEIKKKMAGSDDTYEEETVESVSTTSMVRLATAASMHPALHQQIPTSDPPFHRTTYNLNKLMAQQVANRIAQSMVHQMNTVSKDDEPRMKAYQVMRTTEPMRDAFVQMSVPDRRKQEFWAQLHSKQRATTVLERAPTLIPTQDSGWTEDINDVGEKDVDCLPLDIYLLREQQIEEKLREIESLSQEIAELLEFQGKHLSSCVQMVPDGAKSSVSMTQNSQSSGGCEYIGMESNAVDVKERLVEEHEDDDLTHSSSHIIPRSVLDQLVQTTSAITESDKPNKREWKGLDQKLGENEEPSRLTQGRSGAPQSGYNSQPKTNK